MRLAFRVVVGWFVATIGLVALLRFVDPPTTAFIIERRLEASNEAKPVIIKQQWVPLTSISPELPRAVIAAEDQKFASHHGFDFDQIENAIEDRFENHRSRGASTLTQQVAKNLFLWSGRSFFRKGLEAYFTLLLEALWPKRRILEMHLNIAEYGDGVYGAEAAARVFFRKPASALTAFEASRMAAVLPAPRTRRVTAPTLAMATRAEQIADQARRLEPEVVALINDR